MEQPAGRSGWPRLANGSRPGPGEALPATFRVRMMGAAFIEKATATFKKSWDRARVALATADLFTRAPNCAARTAAAEIVGNAILHVGDCLTVEPQAGGLVAL